MFWWSLQDFSLSSLFSCSSSFSVFFPLTFFFSFNEKFHTSAKVERIIQWACMYHHPTKKPTNPRLFLFHLYHPFPSPHTPQIILKQVSNIPFHLEYVNMDLYNISASPLNVTITPPSHKLTLIPWYYQIVVQSSPVVSSILFWQLVCISQNPNIHTLHLLAMSLKFLLTFRYLPSPSPFLLFFLAVYLLEKLNHLSSVSFSMCFYPVFSTCR